MKTHKNTKLKITKYKPKPNGTKRKKKAPEQINETKIIQKYHCVHFVSAFCCWAQGCP